MFQKSGDELLDNLGFLNVNLRKKCLLREKVGGAGLMLHACNSKHTKKRRMSCFKKCTVPLIREITTVDVTDYPAESIHEIPPPPSPPLHQLPLPAKCYTRVYFDLETTGLGMWLSLSLSL